MVAIFASVYDAYPNPCKLFNKVTKIVLPDNIDIENEKKATIAYKEIESIINCFRKHDDEKLNNLLLLTANRHRAREEEKENKYIMDIGQFAVVFEAVCGAG